MGLRDGRVPPGAQFHINMHQEKGSALANLPDPGKVVPERGCGHWQSNGS
jgi:hypothetical protein